MRNWRRKRVSHLPDRLPTTAKGLAEVSPVSPRMTTRITNLHPEALLEPNQLRGIGEESARRRRRRRRRRMNPKSNLVHPEPFLQTIQLGILGNAPAMRIMNRKMNILHLESFLNANRLRRLGDASAMRIMNRKTNILHLESFLNANRL